MNELALARFDQPHERRVFEKGTFELVSIGGTTLGRATYEPGWRWSEHVGRASGQDLCQVAHLGVVLHGRAAVKMSDGAEFVISEGDVFSIPAGHDSWVVGDEPYVSLHLIGAEDYAATEPQ